MCEEFCGENVDVSSDSLEDTSDVAEVPDEIPEDIDEDLSEDETEGMNDIPEDIPQNTESEEPLDEVAEDEEIPEEVFEDVERAEADEAQGTSEEELQEDVTDEDSKEDDNQESVTEETETVEEAESTEESLENNELPEEEAKALDESSDVADIPDEIPEDIDEDVSEDETEGIDDISEDISTNTELEKTPDEVAEDVEFSEEVSEDVEQAKADEVQKASEEELQEDVDDEAPKEDDNQESVTEETETVEEAELTEESFKNNELPEEEAKPLEEQEDEEVPEDVEIDLNENKVEVVETKDNKELNSSELFEGDNFNLENTYAAEVTSDIVRLADKGQVELEPIGSKNLNESEFEARVPNAEYTQEEIDYLKLERNDIPNPTENTIMQKIAGVDTGNIEEDLKHYLNPRDKDGQVQNAKVFGFVAKAEDIAPFSKTPQECYENARLDYIGTKYTDLNQSVYIVRYTDGIDYSIPYNEAFGGTSRYGQPCRGNGYAGNNGMLIPEYVVNGEEGANITDGAIFKIRPDGKEILVAAFDKKQKCFELYEGEN